MKEICFVCALVGLWLLPAAIAEVIGYRVYKAQKDNTDRVWRALHIERKLRDIVESKLKEAKKQLIEILNSYNQNSKNGN